MATGSASSLDEAELRLAGPAWRPAAVKDSSLESFDRLRMGPFDRLRMGPFDRLRMGPFDRLRMECAVSHFTCFFESFIGSQGGHRRSGGAWSSCGIGEER